MTVAAVYKARHRVLGLLREESRLQSLDSGVPMNARR
jgi:hypothetical protein